MTLATQGPGGSSPILPPQGQPQTTPASTSGQKFGRQVSATSGQSVIQQSPDSSPPGSPTQLNNRRVTGLTAEGLIQIAGAPKEGVFKKSADYKQLLTSIDAYAQTKTAGASRNELIAKLDTIAEQAESFYEKKADKSNKFKIGNSSDKLKGILDRVEGAGTVLNEAKATKAILQLLDTSPGDLVVRTALRQDALEQGADIVQSVLADNPPQSIQELLTLDSLYGGSELLAEHFHNLTEPNKGRTLMLSNAGASDHLRQIAAADWAPGKVAKEVPNVANNAQELGQQWNALEQKLNQQKVPPVGVAAAKEALFSRTIEQWKESPSTTEQNHHLTRRQTLYVQRPKVGATQQTPARFDVQQIASNAERLSAGFERVPAEFQQKLNVGQGAPDSVRGFNQLPKPQFLTAETNMMHKDGFMDKAQVRFKREGNRLPCPADSAVKNSDGEATYHANHVKMPMSQFIAAQGPRENAGLFWNMVDQQDSEVVVDLTNASDPSTAKRSFDYTPPPGETKVYPNGAKVTNHGETRVMGGLFTVQQLEVNGKPRIRIQHNQFNDRTSGSPAELASLATLVRTISPNLAKPVTVHCTAGVGRTSTFIAIQDQVDHLANTGHAHDIQDAAATLRNARGGSAIQTAEQWQTINQVHDNPDAIIGPFLSLAGPAAAG